MSLGLTSLALLAAGAVAGVMNSLAGGGTLVTFPALLFAGVPAIAANATSAVALLAGVGSSIWGYRKELATQKTWAWRLAFPSLAGGLLGAIVLLRTDEAHFRAIVPYLILFATVLFTFQRIVLRKLAGGPLKLDSSAKGVATVLLFQFGVAVYGGYFGAGIGILMLAALGILGQTDIHRMNSLKVLQAFLINVIAAAYFIVKGHVFWMDALIVAAGSAVGGTIGPWLGRCIGAGPVRAFVSIVGFSIGIYLLLRNS